MAEKKRKINARQLAADIRAGLDDTVLAQKYQLSGPQLRGVFKKLVEIGAIRGEDLKNRLDRQTGAAENQPECTACGTVLQQVGKFCPECGASLSDNAPKTSDSIAQESSAPLRHEKARKSDSIRWRPTRKQQILGVLFVAFPLLVFITAFLGIDALGDGSPYPASAQVLYFGLVLACIAFGVISVRLLWNVFKPIALGQSSVTESSLPSLPNSFLELDAERRHLALDRAWSHGFGMASKELAATGSTLMTRYLVPGAGAVGKILLFVFGGNLFLAGIGGSIAIAKSIITPPSDFEVSDLPWMFLAVTAAFMFGALLIASRHFVSSAIARLFGIVSGAEKQAKQSLEYHRILEDLGISFLRSTYDKWFGEMKHSAEAMALSEAAMTPESTFVLFSHPTSLGQNGVPEKKNSAAYVFSNGHVTVVSNVVFDFEATSYTLVHHDAPTYSISKPNTWNVDEFHYQDVVEVTYTASQETGRRSVDGYLRLAKDKIKGAISSEGTPEHRQIEGYLVLSLVNGGNKYYPTTKTAAQNFLQVARENVREAKARKG